MASNREVYDGIEFEKWAFHEGLESTERHLIEQYLDKDRTTLEAGTGGGRIVRALRELGFTSLAGFDYVPRLIEQAKQNDASSQIRFDVQDAVDLDYEDASFDQVVYLQQVLCFMETEAERRTAVREAYRILSVGGVALFSFLWFEDRQRSPVIRFFSRYLGILRMLRRSTRRLQSQPWLRHGNRPNVGSLMDRGPYVYWYRAAEAEQQLRQAGFEIHAIGSTSDAERGRLVASSAHLDPNSTGTGLYVVVKKPRLGGAASAY